MKILAVDYGRKKVGLSVGDTDTRFSEPISVVRSENQDNLIEKICQIARVEDAGQIVVGISEGKTAEETKEFGNKLKTKAFCPVVFFDETLSTHEAQRLSIEAGIKRKKRKNLEDAYAAAIMLQNYLESLSST